MSTTGKQPADNNHAMPKQHTIVMLVDDQPMIAEAVRRMLIEEHDIDFHYCMNADEAEETAADLHPTVILQDLVMPSVDGLELVQRYRANPETADIPIIVLSTKEDSEVKANAFEGGANDYLVKLPDRVELLARIRYHSASYVNKLQRDYAFRSLQESQRRLKELNVELLRLSAKDGLTGIANRRHFDEQVAVEWLRLRRDHEPMSILMIDVDFFKPYNDSLGHLSGDDTLRLIAEILVGSARRPADLVARYGGEEFVVLLPNTSLSDAGLVAERARAAVEEAAIDHPASTVAGCVTVSIGVAAAVPAKDNSVESLILAADKALYMAKQSGRNRTVVSEGPAIAAAKAT